MYNKGLSYRSRRQAARPADRRFSMHVTAPKPSTPVEWAQAYIASRFEGNRPSLSTHTWTGEGTGEFAWWRATAAAIALGMRRDFKDFGRELSYDVAALEPDRGAKPALCPQGSKCYFATRSLTPCDNFSDEEADLATVRAGVNREFGFHFTCRGHIGEAWRSLR
jgi:hypothetical protein